MGEIAKTVRVPLVTDLVLGSGDRATGNTPGEFLAYMKNMYADKAPDGKLVARVRPPLLFSTGVQESKGRGIFNWSANDTVYSIDNATVYRGTSGGTVVGTISAGYVRTYFTEVGTRLFFTDPANSQAWTLQTDHTLTQVTDSDFPSTLAHGVATLNGSAYVMSTSGDIYGSDLEDSTNWQSLNVINAERNPDGGNWIGIHHDHIVAIGPKTIEFFRDSGNSPGSPLTRREDVFYNIGSVRGDAVWRYIDDIYFLGRDGSGSVSMYRLTNFSIEKISNPSLDEFFERHTESERGNWLLSGIQGVGKSFVLLTNLTVNGISTSGYNGGKYTLAYDVALGLWSFFDTDVATNDIFPVVDWCQITAAGSTIQEGRGISATGHIVSINTSSYNDRNTSGGNTPIAVQIRTGWQDGGTNKYKYCRNLELVGNASDDATFTISYSDTANTEAAFTVSRTVSILADYAKRKLTRLGRFVRRNFQITASLSDEVRLEALEVEVAVGDV